MIPQYRGEDVLIITFPPDWDQPVNPDEIYSTAIFEALDVSEERLRQYPRCLYGISFTTIALEPRQQGYFRKLLELAEARPAAMPFWTDSVQLAEGAAIGATELLVTDHSVTIIPVFHYGIIWREWNDWEIFAVDNLSDGKILLTAPLEKAWSSGTLVLPLVLGSLKRPDFIGISAEASAVDINFEEVWHPEFIQRERLPAIPPVEYEFTSSCRDELEFTGLVVPDGEVWIIQVSDSEEGFYGDQIYIDGNGAAQSRILNNDFGGTHWFRVVDSAGVVKRRPVNPEASVVAAPQVSISNLVDVSANPGRELRASLGFVLPYSYRENDMISDSELYVVPRGRLELAMPFSLNWDGNPNILSITGEDGAVHVWTRDGNDPEEDTAMPRLEGYDNNVGAYRNEFAYIVKVRSFKNGCRSPVTCILVDKRVVALNGFTSNGAGQVLSGSCDLPRDGEESGNSCQLLYGGTGPFDTLTRTLCIDAAVSMSGGLLLYRLYNSPVGDTYLGWPIYIPTWSYYTHGTTAFHRNPNFNYAPECWTNIRIHTGLGPPVYRSTGQSVANFTTAAGSSAAIEGTADTYILSEIPLPPEESNDWVLDLLDVILTRHNDWIFWRAEDSSPNPAYEPPATTLPPEPFISLLEGEDWEPYPDTTDAGALTLDEASGIVAPGRIIDPQATSGGDDFEHNAIGDVTDTGLPTGEGLDGTARVFEPPSLIIGGEDFESYTDGGVDNFNFTAGAGISGPAKFTADYNGGETFESQADGDVSDTTMDGGVLMEAAARIFTPI